MLLNIEKIVITNQLLSKVKTSIVGIIIFLFFCGCSHLSRNETTTQEDVSIQREPSAQNQNSVLYEKINFEKCDAKPNNYLEKKLNSLPPEYLKVDPHVSQVRLPVQCVHLAQSAFVGTYARCENEEEKPKMTQIKPCLSEAYTSLAYNAYHDVMDCFNLDSREMFFQIMIESGFHVNAINKTGFDSGMAQFTANGIKRVMANNLIERTRRVLLESSRPSCQRISSIVGSFNIEAFSVKKRCSMIALPKNPYRAMLFSYLHTMLDQISLDELLAAIPELHEALTDKIRRQFLYLSYNRGMTGLKRLLVGYVRSRNEFSQKITEDDLNLNRNLSDVKHILSLEPEKRDILKRSKVRKLNFAEYAVIHNATYLSDMAAARDYVQRYLGNSCGEF